MSLLNISLTMRHKTDYCPCDIKGDFGYDRAIYFDGMHYEINPPPTELDIMIGAGQIHISSVIYARVVTLEGDAYFSDNYFDLLP